MRVVGGILCSIGSSVGLVLLNKRLFISDDFNYPATLTGWHLLVTHTVLHGALRLRMFEHSWLSRKYVVYFAVIDALAMALQNMSLMYNSVNFYQTCKLFTVPVTVFIERILGEPLPKLPVISALILIMLGVAICTTATLLSNPIGVVVGISATVAAAIVIISTSRLQRVQELSSTQLLYNVALIDGIVLSLLGPICDYHLSRKIVYTNFKFSLHTTACVCGTCMLAVSVNCFSFYLLGKVSPISYQVIGQVKTILLYSIAYIVFDETSEGQISFFGVSSALIGCIWYAWLSLKY